MSLIKSKKRIADHGEVFTPLWMVEAMLDLVKGESERIDSRFLEPACGSGNFLVNVLQRKLAAVELKFGRSDFERRHYALLAVMCTYGIELLEDNIAECRANMLEILADYLNLEKSDELYRAASYILSQNLIHGDALKMRTSDDQPITFAEWGYLGKGKFQRRDKKRFDRLVSSRKPFGLDTTFKGKVAKRAGDVLVYQNGGIGYIARSSISNGADLIDKWKLFAGYAAPGTGNKDTYPHRIISSPFVAEPGTISSETFLCIGPFDSKNQAESVLSYLSCRLTRLLILLHKPSQHVTRKVYSFVPIQEWTRRWTDQHLYAKYGISASEIAFIEKVIRPMNLQWSL